MVIWSQNPVYSILFLVLTFSFATLIFLLLDAIFIALVFLMVYVGAIAVLFLFVVMMLNIKTVHLNEYVLNYSYFNYIVGLFVSFIFGFSTIFFKNSDFFITSSGLEYGVTPDLAYALESDVSFINYISELLFIYYAPVLILSGVLLLLAMVGAITLTLEEEVFIRHQNLSKQIYKNYKLNIYEKLKNE